jgi:hypothetical protein
MNAVTIYKNIFLSGIFLFSTAPLVGMEGKEEQATEEIRVLYGVDIKNNGAQEEAWWRTYGENSAHHFSPDTPMSTVLEVLDQKISRMVSHDPTTTLDSEFRIELISISSYKSIEAPFSLADGLKKPLIDWVQDPKKFNLSIEKKGTGSVKPKSKDETLFQNAKLVPWWCLLY